MADVTRDVSGLHVGSRVYRYDPNVRHYTKPASGRKDSKLIWRKSWVELEVIEETSRSFGVGRPGGSVIFKISKKDGSAPVDLLAFSEAEIDDMAYVHEHRATLGRLIYQCEDPAALRQVAAALGFVPPPVESSDA